MSTGLTWVTIYDLDGTVSPSFNTSVIVFNDYNEALNYALWNCKYVYAQFTTGQLVMTIYTESPNENGYVGSASVPVFTPFD